MFELIGFTLDSFIFIIIFSSKISDFFSSVSQKENISYFPTPVVI